MENLKHTKGEERFLSEDAITLMSLLPAGLTKEYQEKAFKVFGRTKTELAAPELLEALNNLVNKFGSVKQVKELGIENELIDAINAINKATN